MEYIISAFNLNKNKYVILYKGSSKIKAKSKYKIAKLRKKYVCLKYETFGDEIESGEFTNKDGLTYFYTIWNYGDHFVLELNYNCTNNCEGEDTNIEEEFDTIDEVRERINELKL